MQKDYKKLSEIAKKEASRKEFLKKISRLIAELSLLNDKPYPLEKMAKELNVELRTVQRDMKLLESAGFPLYAPLRGCRAFPEGYSVEKVKISKKEAAILGVFSDIALNLGETFSDSIDGLRSKMLIPSEENPYYIIMPGGCSLPSHPLFKDIESAVLQHEKIEMKYRGGKKDKYYLSPLRIVWSEGFWYLLAMEEGGKLRTFLVDKISGVYKLGMYFTPPPEIDGLLARSVNIWISAKRDMEVVMEISAEISRYFINKPYFPEEKLIEKRKDGSLLLSCKAADHREVLPVVLSWLPHIKIISPESLKKQLKAKMQEYIAGMSS